MRWLALLPLGLGCSDDGTLDPIRQADVVGTWSKEMQYVYFELCSAAYIGTLDLHRDGTVLIQADDRRIIGQDDPVECLLKGEETSLIEGRWRLVDHGDEPGLLVEVVKTWSVIYDAFEPGSDPPVLDEEYHTRSDIMHWDLAHGVDQQGRWLWTSAHGLHRPDPGAMDGVGFPERRSTEGSTTGAYA